MIDKELSELKKDLPEYNIDNYERKNFGNWRYRVYRFSYNG